APEEDLSEAAAALGEVALFAVRTRDADRHRSGGLAVGVAAAREEAPEPAALDHHPLAAILADLVGGLLLHHLDLAVDGLAEVLGVLAVGVAAAREELPHLPPLDHHLLAALLAVDVGGDLLALHVAHLDFGAGQRLLERTVEVAEHGDPVGFAL